MDGIQKLYRLFNNNNLIFILFLILLVFLFSQKGKTQIKDYMTYAFLGLFICFNPFLSLFSTQFIPLTRIVRVFWLLPISVILSYGCVTIVTGVQNKSKQIIISVLLLTICVMTGNVVYGSKNFKSSENLYKIPNETIVICNAIKEDGNRGALLASKDMSSTVRQYDAGISLVGGRYHADDYWDICKNDNNLISARNISVSVPNATYVLMKKDTELAGNMENFNYEILKDTGKHILYKKTIQDLGQLFITRYAALKENGKPFYVITNYRGEMMIINGDWKTDENILSEIIKKQGGIIDNWVLTNPGINDLANLTEAISSGNVIIGSVIMQNLRLAKGSSDKWDEIMDTFMKVAEDKGVHVLFYPEGASFQVLGASVDIFHGYERMSVLDSEEHREGLVFKISTENQSVLFLAETKQECIEYILERYGDSLRSEYLQIGGTVTKDLFKNICTVVLPETIFEDNLNSNVIMEIESYIDEINVGEIYFDSYEKQIFCIE